MQENYYIPEIEDIRIGYEGEINWSRGYSDIFVPFKITVQNEDFAYTGLLSEIVDAIDDGYAEVRVPYLTKEQIEAEGWKRGLNPNGLFKGNNTMDFLDNTGRIIISQNGSVSFCGECKSINEFRYITKLLGIC